MDVSVVIVAWNVRELLYNCLKSVYEETKDLDFEVIYVDNASEDGSVEMVEENFPEVSILQNKENRGFVVANNQGIEIAKGRYVLLLNSDTVILDNAIAKSVEFADKNPQAAVIGCRVVNPDRTLQPTGFMFPSTLNMLLSCTYLYKIFPKSRFFGREHMTWWDRNDIREIDAVTGCYMLVRRKAIEQVGAMDKRYFIYCEETDWCYRFKENGWKIMFTPVPEIIHYGGQTTKQRADKFKLQLYGSKLIFMKKYKNKLSFLFARFFTALFFFFRAPYYFTVAVFSKHERKQSIRTAIAYLTGCFFSLVDWKRLLMNREVVKETL